MIIPKNELEKLIERYDSKAQTQFRNYQETGMTRYETAYRNAEDLADTLRVALNASDDHAALVSIRAQLSALAGEAARAETAEKRARVLENLIAFARLTGLVSTDTKLPKEEVGL